MVSPLAITAPRLESLGLSPGRPLVLVDVDEVLGLFMQGFGAFLQARGYEFRVDRFALFQNIYRPGAAEHLEIGLGQGLYDDFFDTSCDQIDPAPGAAQALASLAQTAQIAILSNAPAGAQVLRAAWLARHQMPYPLILNVGPKGPMVAALASQAASRTAFVDDLLQNLDSVIADAPGVATFQHVADPRLRALAPRSCRHRRIDDWAELGAAIAAAVGDEQPNENKSGIAWP